MKKIGLLLLMMALYSQMNADTIYVSANGVGDGSSWGSSLADVNAAITVASSGDQVWVAKGVYTPGTSRSSSFILKGQLKVYGGFSGSETDVDSRSDYGNGGMNQTILSGDIGVLDDVSDNVYTVVKRDGGSGLVSDNLLDGFIIADGNGSNPPLDTDGVGLYCTNGAKLLVNKCVIKDCINGDEAGGTFIIGGALVIFNEGEIRDCSANSSGGAGTTIGGGQLDCVNSLIVGNTILEPAGAGGAFYTTNGGLLNLIDSELYGNAATGGRGGALYAQYADLSVTNCHFANNFASDGGALYFIGGAPDVNNCIIANNEASNNGGGMYLGQWTRLSGAELYVYTSDPIFANNTIVNNKSQTGNGGGVYTQKASALFFINNIFSGNAPYELSITNQGLNLAYSYVKGGESGIDLNGYAVTYPGGTYESTNTDGLLTFEDSTTSVGNDPSSPSYEDADWTVLSGSVTIDAGSPTVACGVATYPSLCVDNDSNRVRYNAEHVTLLPNVCADGKDRVDGTIDIGAFELENIPTGLQQNSVAVERFVYASGRELFFDLDEAYTVEVFNLQGQLMMQRRLEGKSQLDVEMLDGFYLVRVNTPVGVKTAKVLIQ